MASFDKELYTYILDIYKSNYDIECSEKFNCMFYSRFVKPKVRGMLKGDSSHQYFNLVDPDEDDIYEHALQYIIFEGEIEYLTERINLVGRLHSGKLISELYLPDEIMQKFVSIIKRKGLTIDQATIKDFIEATATLKSKARGKSRELLPYFERFASTLALNPYGELDKISLDDYKVLLKYLVSTIDTLEAIKNNLEKEIQDAQSKVGTLRSQKADVEAIILDRKKTVKLYKKMIGNMEDGNQE